VTKGEAIEKLEGLLARVRMRAVRAKAFDAAPAVSWSPAPSKVEVDDRRVATEAVEPESIELEAEEPVTVEPEADQPSEADRMVASGEGMLSDSEIEVEPGAESHDSRERLVAAGPVSVEQVSAQAVAAEPLPVEPVAPVQESTPPLDVTDLDDVVAPEEEPPISSRRMVVAQADERLAHMAFGSDEPPAPLHTPPPESGRLPATPAADFDPDPDVTGVRDATPLLPLRAQPVAREMAPDAMRPQLVPSDMVADVIAEAQGFSPSTFVGLLDASLSL
jgi:hypothetical protein